MSSAMRGSRPRRSMADASAPERALNVAQLRGASFAEIRIEDRRTQSISVKNGAVDALLTEEGQGFGIRVIADGAWGFAASPVLSAPEIERIAELAVKVARASA